MVTGIVVPPMEPRSGILRSKSWFLGDPDLKFHEPNEKKINKIKTVKKINKVLNFTLIVGFSLRASKIFGFET